MLRLLLKLQVYVLKWILRCTCMVVVFLLICMPKWIHVTDMPYHIYQSKHQIRVQWNLSVMNSNRVQNNPFKVCLTSVCIAGLKWNGYILHHFESGTFYLMTWHLYHNLDILKYSKSVYAIAFFFKTQGWTGRYRNLQSTNRWYVY